MAQAAPDGDAGRGVQPQALEADGDLIVVAYTHAPTAQYRHNRTGEDNADAHLKR